MDKSNFMTTSSHIMVSTLHLTLSGSSEASACELAYSYAVNYLLFVLQGYLVQTPSKHPLRATFCKPLQARCLCAFLSFKVGRMFRSHLASGPCKANSVREALGGKVMSQGLRVGVEFSSAQQLLGLGDIYNNHHVQS